MTEKASCDSANIAKDLLALVIFIHPHLINLFVVDPMKVQLRFVSPDNIAWSY